MKPRGQAFTVSYHGLARELALPVGIGKPGKGEDDLLAFSAIWDTGATNTVISQTVIEKLGLVDIIDIVDTRSADGPGKANAYYVDIELPNLVHFNALKVVHMKIASDVLIGMDIIGTGDCCITNIDGQTTLTFEYPSTHCYDFVKQINAGLKPSPSPQRRPRKRRR